MALRDEIAPYLDGNGLVCPNTGVWQSGQRGSDNGPMFTSEFFVMAKKLGQNIPQDPAVFANLIGACITPEGMLSRCPVLDKIGQEGPDDYYGVLNACKALGNTEIPRRILWAVVRYLGFLNNDEPGKKTGASFLVRQLQMVGAMFAAAFPSKWNPLHFVCRFLAIPLFFAAAISIAVSCINAPTSDTDARRLSWHLQETTKGVSVMCWLASLIWMRRLYKDYPDGMKGVAAIYYQSGHPFAKYWVTE